jgi:hypothetical protein
MYRTDWQLGAGFSRRQLICDEAGMATSEPIRILLSLASANAGLPPKSIPNSQAARAGHVAGYVTSSQNVWNSKDICGAEVQAPRKLFDGRIDMLRWHSR